MVKVIRNPKKPYSEPHVHLEVYRKPTDKAVIVGVWGHEAQTGEREATFSHSGFSVPIEKAYRDAFAFCERHGIEHLLLIDPEGLFNQPG